MAFETTKYYDDFLEYHRKAQILQDKNCGKYHPDSKCFDPIMDNITIYDTVNRKYAGFSKALEDIHGVRCENHHVRYGDFSDKLDIKQFHFIHLFHRFTGSGASFRPTFDDKGARRDDEHGYYNNKVEILCKSMLNKLSVKPAIDYIVSCNEPMVTSIGNQPPSLKNEDPRKYRLAMQYYFDNFADQFVEDYLRFLYRYKNNNQKPSGIKDAVDFCCVWHKEKGFKQWHFVLTAFVMDTAEYYPELVDRKSHCYYGANCVRGFKLMFNKTKRMKNKEWYEICMADLVKARKNISNPYDMEDVVCDYIRYVTQYLPKGYDHLPLDETVNKSTLKVNGEYPLDVKKRLTEVIGYYDYRTKSTA